MTQEEKNVLLAKAAGWRLFSQFKNLWAPPKHIVEYDCDAYPLPNYFECLNACRELEKILTFHQETEYIANLMRAYKDYPMTKGFMASAEERAEAIGKTLGLW
jgi:hypothetical protein